MKTKNASNKKDYRNSILTISLMILCTACSLGQDAAYRRTLFRPDLTMTQVWSPEVKINTIQGRTGMLVGLYGGVLFDQKFLLGLAGGVNLTHPTVNYGYFGGIGQYIIYPGNTFHVSGQLLLAYGTTRDYENPKSGLMDNFWNISGEIFYMSEPGINVEVNLTEWITFVAGVSYRTVTGIDSDNENVSRTHLTNQDMNGFNLNIGIKFRKREKQGN